MDERRNGEIEKKQVSKKSREEGWKKNIEQAGSSVLLGNRGDQQTNGGLGRGWWGWSAGPFRRTGLLLEARKFPIESSLVF